MPSTIEEFREGLSRLLRRAGLIDEDIPQVGWKVIYQRKGDPVFYRSTTGLGDIAEKLHYKLSQYHSNLDSTGKRWSATKADWVKQMRDAFEDSSCFSTLEASRLAYFTAACTQNVDYDLVEQLRTEYSNKHREALDLLSRYAEEYDQYTELVHSITDCYTFLNNIGKFLQLSQLQEDDLEADTVTIQTGSLQEG